jgi:hypothetical protein
MSTCRIDKPGDGVCVARSGAEAAFIRPLSWKTLQVVGAGLARVTPLLEVVMKVLVLGGGVIGVSTAYYLAKAGHEVELVDRQSGAALETSFGNAGEVSPGSSAACPSRPSSGC